MAIIEYRKKKFRYVQKYSSPTSIIRKGYAAPEPNTKENLDVV